MLSQRARSGAKDFFYFFSLRCFAASARNCSLAKTARRRKEKPIKTFALLCGLCEKFFSRKEREATQRKTHKKTFALLCGLGEQYYG